MATGENSREIDYDTLIKKKQEPNVVLIDVREPAEIQETGKLPGSIHIPLGELETALNSLPEEQFAKKYGGKKPSKLAEIIFSCRSGRRSLLAMEVATKIGYTRTKSYKGGFLEWAEKNQS